MGVTATNFASIKTFVLEPATTSTRAIRFAVIIDLAFKCEGLKVLRIRKFKA